jgi:hypothetical protein
MLFKDRTNGAWHAHAVSPWLGDEHLPYWAPDYESRAYINGTGATAAAAVLALFNHPRRAAPPTESGIVLASARLAVEIALLVETIRRD